MLKSDQLRVVSFERSEDEGGVVLPVPVTFWAVVVQVKQRHMVLYETDRRGVAAEKLADVRRLLCEARSEWRAGLPKGLDQEFGLWGYAARPSGSEVRAARVAKIKAGKVSRE
jgi:hypothetical protein